MQHVIQTIEGPRGFHRQDVMWLFDDADPRPVAIRVAAIWTEFGVSDVIAFRADAQVVFDVNQRRSQRRSLIARRTQNVKRQTLCRFLPDSGQSAELIDQAL